MNIQQFSDELQRLIQTNENQKAEIQLYKDQLLIIVTTFGGRMKDLNYDDLLKVNWDKIRFGIGHTSCSVTNTQTDKLIKKWDDVPLNK